VARWPARYTNYNAVLNSVGWLAEKQENKTDWTAFHKFLPRRPAKTAATQSNTFFEHSLIFYVFMHSNKT
jgi:hypothetical protein